MGTFAMAGSLLVFARLPPMSLPRRFSVSATLPLVKAQKDSVLEVKGLKAIRKNDGVKILNGVDLKTEKEEIHTIAGHKRERSALIEVLSGDTKYEVTEGSISFKGQNLLDISPFEIPGLFVHPTPLITKNIHSLFLDGDESNKQKLIDFIEFKKKALALKIPALSFSSSDVLNFADNKLIEVLRILLLEPDLAIFDDIERELNDSQIVCMAKVIKESGSYSMLFMTDFSSQIVGDFNHDMENGKITMRDRQ